MLLWSSVPLRLSPPRADAELGGGGPSNHVCLPRLIFGTLYPAYSSYKAVKTKNVKEYVSEQRLTNTGGILSHYRWGETMASCRAIQQNPEPKRFWDVPYSPPKLGMIDKGPGGLSPRT